MNWRAIRAIMRKDLLAVRRSPMVMLPMIILPVILMVLMPAGMGLAIQLVPEEEAATEADMEAMLAAMPPQVLEPYAHVDGNTLIVILMLVYVFAPLYLIIPMMVSSVIAADSFVGERERKTLEALLHSPITSLELLVSKMLSAWLAAIAVALGSFALYAIIVNAMVWREMGGLFFPNAVWLVLVLWVSPAVAGLGLAFTVLISSRVKTFQEAYQFGGMVVLPVVGLMMAQLGGVVFLSTGFAIGMGAFVWLLDALLLWTGVKTFSRGEMLARI